MSVIDFCRGIWYHKAYICRICCGKEEGIGMRTKMRKFLSSAVAMLLCTVMLLGMLPDISAESAALHTIIDPDSLNYALPDSETNMEISASELMQRLFGELSFSQEELAYMNENLFSLTYHATVSDDAVKTVYDKESGVLQVAVSPYTYTAKNGSTVSWYPKEIALKLNGVLPQRFPAMPDDNGKYICRFENLFYVDDNFEMEITFAWDAALSADVIEHLLLASRADGMAAEETLAQYARELADYQTALAAYQAYIQYGEELAARTRYEQELAAYLIKKAEYDAYVEKKLAYDTQMKKYEDYLKAKAEYEVAWDKYEKYKDFLDKYGKEYSAYLIYRQKYDAAVAKLRVMEMLFVSDSHKWQVYASVMGPTVTSVLARKDELAMAGYTKGEQAAQATDALRVLLKGYADLRAVKYNSQFERNKALYAYYCEHYTALKTNFDLLYRALLELYNDGIIIDMIEKEGKGPHFRQFLGQLYITTCCLNDAEALSLSWTPTSKFKQTLAELVEPCQMLTDHVKADPSGDPFPDKEVPKVEPDEVVSPPGAAPDIEYPPEEDPPEPVPEPTEPTFVAHPGQEPPYAEHPGEAPAHGLSDVMVAWASAYRLVDYAEREALIEPRTLTLQTSLKRPVSIENKFRVAFYDYDGKLLGEGYYELGANVAVLLSEVALPKRASTAQYDYAFSSWKLPNGDLWTEETVSSDVSLIAAYRSEVRRYTVAWEIDGELIESPRDYFYGAMPAPNKTVVPEKIVNYKKYVFSGWSPSVEPVTGDVVYRGSYVPEDLYYTVTWVLDNGARVEEQQVLAGTEPVYAGAADFIHDSKLYPFFKWSPMISVVSGDVTYVAHYHAGVPFSYSADGSATKAVYRDGRLYVDIGESTIPLGEYEKFARNNGCDVVFSNGNASVLLTAEQLTRLLADNCSRMAFATRQDSRGTAYTLAYYDNAGNVRSTNTPAMLLYQYTAQPNAAAFCYRKDGPSWIEMECSRSNGVLRAAFEGAGTFWMGLEYYVRFQGDNCSTLKLPTKAYAGEKINLLKADCVDGFEVTGAILTFANGRVQAINETEFTMPAEAVSVALTVKRIIYRVSFTVDGKVVETQEYYLRDEIRLPEAPTLNKDDGYVYSFVKWVPAQTYPYYPYLTIAYGAVRDITVEAEFVKSIVANEQTQSEIASDSVVKRVTLVVSIAVGVIAIAVLLIVFRKKLFKKRKT